MKHIYNTEEFQLENSAVCLGKFDGIHKGHQLLLNKILTYKELQSVVFTFALHPSNLFSDKETKLIDTIEEKKEKLEKMGIDTLVSFPFTKETAGMKPEDFIREILVEKIGAKVIVVGVDFRFGYQRTGSVDVLKAYAKQYGYEVVALEKLADEQQVVSSTRIREEIQKGNMEKVTRLMGTPYAITGEVIHGKQLGRTIGMPTINQEVSSTKILPPKGVYVSRVFLKEGVFKGITNIGTKPTVSGEQQLGVETHIMDYCGDLYGKKVKIEMLYFVRGERKFNSVDELKQQMHCDKQFGEDYFTSADICDIIS